MAFQVSPGVQIREFDLTAIVPAVSTTPAAYVGVFKWGPADQRVLVNTEKQLESIFFKPLNDPYYATSWMLASNFLSYGGNLQVVRSVSDSAVFDAINGNDANSVSIKLYPDSYGNSGSDITTEGNVGNGSGSPTEALIYMGPTKGCYQNGVPLDPSHPKYVARIDTVIDYDRFADENDSFYYPTEFGIGKMTARAVWGNAGFAPEYNFSLYTDCNCDGRYDDSWIDVNGNGQYESSEAKSFFNNTRNQDYFALSQLTESLLDVAATIRDKTYDSFDEAMVRFRALYDKIDISDGNTSLRQLCGYFAVVTGTEFTGFESNYINLQDYIELVKEIFIETARQKTITDNSLTLQPGTFIQIKNRQHFEDLNVSDGLNIATFYGKYPGTAMNGVGVVIYAKGFTNTYASSTDTGFDESLAVYPAWAKSAFKVFKDVPGTTDQAANLGFSDDEIHVAVVDVEGKVTGVKGQVIEYFEGLSLASDAKKPDGTANYWESVINNRSQYIWVGNTDADLQFNNDGLAWGTPFNGSVANTFASLVGTQEPIGTSALKLIAGDVAGDDGEFNSSDEDVSARILAQYENSFGDADESDVSILIGYNTTIPSDINDFVAIAERRKDAIAFVSACYSLDLIGGTRANILEGITDFVDATASTSYGAMDSGYKYQYDRFNTVYRYVPLCADSAGCAVRTDNQKDPWFSPAGYDRGRVLNIVKLVFNPNKDERDVLYKKNVNPVITSQGFGAIVFGDKTLQKKASAFDRINVRRLFNVLEKSIATAAKFQLFEFNDSFTRSQFKQLVEPFLRDIQGRRGITSYAVVCDESNNTPSIIDSNQFVADIFVAPNRSINFITLNFIATPTGVTFAEYGG